MELKYKHMGRYIFRIPLFPIQMLEHPDYQNPLFKEALLIASPELYREFRRISQSSGKMQRTLYKYWSRACTRATPFGLFGACSVGNISDTTAHLITSPDKIFRRTRLDMKYMCELVQYLEKDDCIRSTLVFYPNDSVYKVGTSYRYVEYIYEQGKRVHYLQEIELSKHLNTILNSCIDGATIDELEEILIQNGVNNKTAHSFIIELIDNQLLVSDITPNITGEDTLSTLIIKLQQKKVNIDILNSLSNLLKEIDHSLVPNRELYKSIERIVENIGVPFESKYLLQVDTFRDSITATMSNEVIKDIEEAVAFLIKINQDIYKRKTKLDDFVTKYRDRFEDEEMPLLLVLDSEIGISYPEQTIDSSQFLIHPMAFPSSNNNLSEYERVILNKYITELTKTGKCAEVAISESDFNLNSNSSAKKLVPTINVVAEFKKNENYSFVYLKGVGGATAASMIGRFAYMDNRIESIMWDICKAEEDNVPDCLIGEIVHLPDSRVGNVTSRKHFRNCEITYLASVGNKEIYHIPVSDIMIRIVDNEIILRSKRFNKRILPKLSNAHNYSLDSTPVYRFLCDLQYHNSISPHINSINGLINLCHYSPRIRFNNCYLSLRKWKICYTDIFETPAMPLCQMLAKVAQVILEKGLPDSVLLQEGDNSLHISFKNETSVRVFCEILKRDKVVILEEYMAPDGSVSDSNNGQYNAEYVIPLKLQKNE